ncbi:hypothetical protein [Cyclobacterium qasimii]|uniref:Peptide methionine sulfoxide reductase n=2 Tax=Cyclobacterium qasimii TaxID=1350429 RepID=S7WUK1_9BACT|nr:hypothetical protein [Cyclobacterium qasimii]EPR67733.1 hypothetical protein ADICYQ_3159 [Cyclobacterium qasimii M12-11B]GEO20335.1 hypothetical protein CQA01_08690 [Cyclobacterium qasimii]
MLLEYIHKLPIGFSEVLYADKKYGLTRTDFNKGKSIKIYAEELGGTNFISLNYYVTSSKEFLKPCEMPEEKVIHFLKNLSVLPLG